MCAVFAVLRAAIRAAAAVAFAVELVLACALHIGPSSTGAHVSLVRGILLLLLLLCQRLDVFVHRHAVERHL